MAAVIDAPRAAPPVAPAPVLALVEVLDRDGQVRQSAAVHAWPFRIGRAIDNDLVVSDPHVAAHHLTLVAADAEATGDAPGATVRLCVGATRNGVQAGGRHWHSGDEARLVPQGDAAELLVGRTRLRLRLAGAALAPEQPVAVLASRRRRILPTAAAGLLLVAGLVFHTYLQSDPDPFYRALGGTLLTALAATAVWCSAWALLSKTFTRQAHFGWHLRVFVCTALALLAVDAAPNVLAFAFSWPAASAYSFVATFLVAATGFYFHLLAVEPARHRLLKWVAATGAVVGIALTLWFNLQRTDRLGDELYMYHLMPPGMRLVRPVATDGFVDRLSTLKAGLDRKARDRSDGAESGAGEDDDE